MVFRIANFMSMVEFDTEWFHVAQNRLILIGQI